MIKSPIRIKVNEYLFINIIFNNNDVIIDNTNIPDEALSFTKDNDNVEIRCCDELIATIRLSDNDIVLTNTTLTTTEVKNYAEDVRARGYNRAFRDNREMFKEERHEGIPYPIELHTHFMEVLSGEEFLRLISEYITKIPLDSSNKIVYCPIDSNNPTKLDVSKVHKWISIEEALKDPSIVEQFRVPTDKQVEFRVLSEGLSNRNTLIDIAGYYLSINQLQQEAKNDTLTKAEADNIKSKCKLPIFINMLFASIDSLKEQGVKYVEFSYSNHNTLKSMINVLRATNIEGIQVRFLLSENRSAKSKLYRRNSRAVKEFLDEYEEVVGFDLMGLEDEITPIEYQNTGTCKTLYDRLRFTIENLLESNRSNPTLRLHAGEIYYNREGSPNNNPQFILEILKQIEDDLGVDLSSRLNIRIGHGLHFQPTEEYFNLLKHFNVVVELCASSNFALGNVFDLKDIPYKTYEEHDIPFVIGTDGGGFYLTTLKQESALLGTFGGDDLLKKIANPINPTNPNNDNNEDYDDESELSIESIFNTIIEKHKNTEFINEYINSTNQTKYINDYFKSNYTLDIEEEHLFPEGISEEEKLKMELVRLQGFYHDKVINEVFFTKEQERIILSTFNKIEESLKKHNLLDTAVLIFSLEQYLNCRSRIEKTVLYMKSRQYTIEEVLGIEHKKEIIAEKIPEVMDDYKEIDKYYNIHSFVTKVLNKDKDLAEDYYKSKNTIEFERELFDNNDYSLSTKRNSSFDTLQEKEKIYIELRRTVKNIDKKEKQYTENQYTIIEEALYNAYYFLENDDLLSSAAYLVSLQTVLNMQVKLDLVYLYMESKGYNIKDFIDVQEFLKEDDKEKGRGRKK